LKAVVKKGYGPGEVFYEDISVPEVGDCDILIKVKAAGICGSDLGLVYGTVEGKTVDYPIVIGHEFAGEICKTGKNVTAWKVGDRVVSDNTGYVCGSCHACSTGDYLNCAGRKGMGNDMDGGMAEYALIPGQVLKTFPCCLWRIPDNVSFAHASILDPLCNAYKSIVQEAAFKPGENIVVFGAGALGLFCVQVASIMGANRIIVAGMSEDKAVRFGIAKKLGATHCIVADEQDVAAETKKIAGENGVSVVMDCAGAPVVLKQSIDLLRNGGKIVKIGYSKNPVDFSLDWLALKGLTLIGHMGYDSASWRSCIALLEAGRVDMDAIISHHMPLSEWQKGFEMVKNRQATKVVLLPEKQ